jgi:hypothetical protein
MYTEKPGYMFQLLTQPSSALIQECTPYFLEHGIHFVHVSYSAAATCNKLNRFIKNTFGYTLSLIYFYQIVLFSM